MTGSSPEYERPLGVTARAEPRAWDLLARAAAQPAGLHESGEVRELLRFDLAGSPYALPIERVREIVRLRTLTPIPRAPQEVCGVIVLRGEVVQVIDLRGRLRLESGETTRHSRVIVLHAEDGRVTGLLVDAVRAVIHPPETNFRANASTESIAVSELCLHEDELVSVIDLDRILDLDGSH